MCKPPRSQTLRENTADHHGVGFCARIRQADHHGVGFCARIWQAYHHGVRLCAIIWQADHHGVGFCARIRQADHHPVRLCARIRQADHHGVGCIGGQNTRESMNTMMGRNTGIVSLSKRLPKCTYKKNTDTVHVISIN